MLSRILECCIAILEFYHIVCFYQGGSEEALIVNSNPLTQVSDVVFIRLNQHHCTEYTRSFIIFNVICQSAKQWTETTHLVVSLWVQEPNVTINNYSILKMLSLEGKSSCTKVVAFLHIVRGDSNSYVKNYVAYFLTYWKYNWPWEDNKREIVV